MGPPPDSRFLTLHALRLKGFAEADAIAEATGLDSSAVLAQLDQLASDDLVAYRSGLVSGWSLRLEGRELHRTLVAEHTTAAEGELCLAYERFLAVNGDLLQVCTDWQLRPVDGQVVPNDHADRAYDETVIGRLVAIDVVVQEVCRELAAVLDRFARYGPRLAAARERVEAGDHDWFLKPIVGSYHTVWYELHEDFLVSLGIERGAEPSAR